MKIRRFFAPDMRRAIQLVRNEQGADAVILSSRAVDGGVEIVSAVDYDHELIAQMARSSVPAAPRSEGFPERGDADAENTADPARRNDTGAGGMPAAPQVDRVESVAAADAGAQAAASPKPVFDLTAAAADAFVTPAAAADASAPSVEGGDASVPPAPGAAADASAASATDRRSQRRRRRGANADDPGLAALRLELKAMKCMLREQLKQASWADLKRLQPERALLSTRVASLGLDPGLTDELVAEVEHPQSSRAWREVMFGLARRLSVPKDDPIDEGGVFALVGPTGVGKTTTIAKLAARHCMRYGRESIALISTDTMRIGAQRQLDAFAAILGVPVRTASDGEELGHLLRALRGRRLVLIDTAGMAPRDRRLAESMRQLEAVRSIRRYIVLAANMQPGAMDDAVRAFGASNLAGAVLTKLDEVGGLGPALSVLIRQRLKAVWLSDGQRVPEDLRLASGTHLLRWAFERDRTTEPVDPHLPSRRHGAAHAAV